MAFLNTLGRSEAEESRFEGSAFPQPLSVTGRQLPEDFVMRGLIWAKHYFPRNFFEGQIVDEGERTPRLVAGLCLQRASTRRALLLLLG